MAIVGIAIVGSANFLFPSKNSSSTSSSTQILIGYLLVIISLFTNGVFFVSEELLFKKFHLHPFQVVGTEGIWGLCIYAIVLPILTYAHCPVDFLGKEACVYQNNN